MSLTGAASARAAHADANRMFLKEGMVRVDSTVPCESDVVDLTMVSRVSVDNYTS